MTSSTRAFVPGHLTLFFTVDRTDHPRTTGSRGVGIVVEEGVEVGVSPGEGCVLNDEPTTIDPVSGVLDRLDVEARVTVRTDLPVGMGFGVSGAATLGTALAVNTEFDLAMSENELIAHAHIAEVEAGTGLGDVVAQARGGVPIRLEPGAPPDGSLDGIPATGRVEYLSRGTISTEAILAGNIEPITRAGSAALDALRESPTLEGAVILGRSFSQEVGLADSSTWSVVEDVLAVDGEATMGLLGRTVVALDDGLTRAGYDPIVTAIEPTGATVLSRS